MKALIMTLALALALLFIPPPPEAEAIRRTTTWDLRVVQSNIGSGTECSPPMDCLATVEAQISSFGPYAIALQEVCAQDRDEFQARFPTWDIAWRDFVSDHAGCGSAKGIMVAAPVIERVRNIDLSADYNGKDFGAVCADIGTVWVCSTHLIAKFTPEDAPTKIQQVRELFTATDSWSRVAIAGDYNMGPGHEAFDIFRDRGWVETDRADNEPTHNAQKFDHIWYHRGTDVPPDSVSGGVVNQPTSGHNLLRGLAKWSTP